MERAIRIGKTLRNNWKKSTFGALVAAYAISKGKEKYEINVLMRAACEQAARYGDAHIARDRNPKVITVILNPVANERAAKSDYEKYCEPILHLAGLEVELVSTSGEGNAKEIAERLHGTEAIVVAGGDGTLAETVTGLLRRNDNATQFPLGILPLGKSNTFGNQLFPTGPGPHRVKQLIDASMAVVKAETTPKHVMKIEPLAGEANARPIYALSSVEWGAFRDAIVKKDKYWFTGSLREYATFVFNGYKDSLSWNCFGTLRYSPPCNGCNNCVVKPIQHKSKWSFFMPPQNTNNGGHLADVVNEDCAKTEDLCFKSCELKVTSPNIAVGDGTPSLKLFLGKTGLSYVDFVSEGWSRLKGKSEEASVVGRAFEIIPEEGASRQQIAIDGEEYDVKAMRVTLLRDVIKLFYNR